VFLSDSSQNTARNNLFKELFRGITLDDVFDDITSTKTRNKVRKIKTADTLEYVYERTYLLGEAQIRNQPLYNCRTLSDDRD
jgi:hypothetical protein